MGAEEKNVPRAPLDAASSDALYDQFVDAFETTRRDFGSLFTPYPTRGVAVPEVFFATVQDGGPNGEADYQDARYFLKRATTDTSLDYDKAGTGKDVYATIDEDMFGPGIGPNLIATNLAELPKKDGQYRHSMHIGDPVLVTAVRSKANPQHKYYVFHAHPPGMLSVYSLSQDGGADGDRATPCSYTYTVTDWNSNTIGTSVSPQVGRPNGSMIPAVFGQGYYAQDGLFFLLYAFEIPNTSSCP